MSVWADRIQANTPNYQFESYRRKDVRNWFPQAELPAANTQDKTCLCNTAACPLPESFHPDKKKSNELKTKYKSYIPWRTQIKKMYKKKFQKHH